MTVATFALLCVAAMWTFVIHVDECRKCRAAQFEVAQ